MFTQEVADNICAQLAEGKSLREITRQEGMPHHTTVLNWVRDRPEFQAAYIRAREVGDDFEFEGIVEIADEEPTKLTTGGIDPAWVANQKSRIDARKWSLARKRPMKYGDKVEMTHAGRIGVAKELSEEELVAIAAGSRG